MEVVAALVLGARKSNDTDGNVIPANVRFVPLKFAARILPLLAVNEPEYDDVPVPPCTAIEPVTVPETLWITPDNELMLRGLPLPPMLPLLVVAVFDELPVVDEPFSNQFIESE